MLVTPSATVTWPVTTSTSAATMKGPLAVAARSTRYRFAPGTAVQLRLISPEPPPAPAVTLGMAGLGAAGGGAPNHQMSGPGPSAANRMSVAPSPSMSATNGEPPTLAGASNGSNPRKTPARNNQT